MATQGMQSDGTASITFALERFEWAGPERLEVRGRWSGLGDVELGPPDLVVALKHHSVRITAMEADNSLSGDNAEWSAAFYWRERRPMTLGPARLEFPDGMVVELPQVSTSPLRFARQRFARVLAPPQGEVAPPESAPDEPMVEEPVAEEPVAQEPVAREAAAAEPEPVATEAAAPEAAQDDDPLARHAETVALRERVLALEEELELAREEAQRERLAATRATDRRHADVQRLHGELDTARALAAELHEREREARAEAERARVAAEADADGARAARDTAMQERAEAVQLLDAEREGIEHLRGALLAAEERAAEAERVRHELAEAQSQREVAQAADLAAVQAARDAAKERERSARERLEALRRAIDDALAGE